MATQADIARALNIAQATVSKALHGDRTISAALRKQVLDTAKKIGYNPNNYLSVLMSNIRAGKKLIHHETFGLLVDARSLEEWYVVESLRLFHEGMLQRAHELGVHIESFFLKQPGVSATKIDHILQARGISGIILAPPYRGNRALDMHWEKYAAIGIGFGWEEQELNRVAYDNSKAFIIAFQELRRQGYRRIGTVFDKIFVEGNRRGIKWYPAYLDCQDSISKSERIPLLADQRQQPGETFSPEQFHRVRDNFKKWILKWKPDAILTMAGDEKQWIEDLGFQIPQDIGLACLSCSVGSGLAGVNQNSEIVGATAIELIASQIARNEFGPPLYPKVTLIPGQWQNGSTVLNKRLTA